MIQKKSQKKIRLLLMINLSNYFSLFLIMKINLIIKRNLKSLYNTIVPQDMLQQKQGKKITVKVLKSQMKIMVQLLGDQLRQFHQILQAQQNFTKFLKLKFFKQIQQQKSITEQIKKYCSLSKNTLKSTQKKIIQSFFQRSLQKINLFQDFLKFVNKIIKEIQDKLELDSKSSLKTDKSSSILANSQNESSKIDLMDLTGDFEKDLCKVKMNDNYYDKNEEQNQRSSQDIQQEEIKDQKKFFQQLKKKEIEQLTEQENQYEKRMTLPCNLNKLNLGLNLDPIIELPIQENQRNILMSKGNLSKYSLDTYMNKSERSRKSINLFAPSNKNSKALLNSQVLKKNDSKKSRKNSRKSIKQKAKKFYSVRGKSANIQKNEKKKKLNRKKVPKTKKKDTSLKNKKGKNIKIQQKIIPLNSQIKTNQIIQDTKENIKKDQIKEIKSKKQNIPLQKLYKKFISQSLDKLKPKTIIKTYSIKKLKLVVSKQTLIQFHQEIQKTFALNDLMTSTRLPKNNQKKQSDDLKTLQTSFQMNEFVRDNSLKSIEISKIEKLNLLRPLNSQVLEHSDLNLNLMNLIQGNQTSPGNRNELKSHVVKLSQFVPNNAKKQSEVNIKNENNNAKVEQVNLNYQKLKQKAMFRKNKKFMSSKQNNRKSKLQLLLNKSFQKSEYDQSMDISRNDLITNKFFGTYANDQNYPNKSYQIGYNKCQNEIKDSKSNANFDIKNFYKNRKNSTNRNRNRSRKFSRLSKSFVGSQLDTSQYTILLKDNDDLTKNLKEKPKVQQNFQKQKLSTVTPQVNPFKPAQKNFVVPLHRSRLNSYSQRQVQKAPLKCRNFFKKLISYSLQIDSLKKKLQNQTNFDTQSLFNFYKNQQNNWNADNFLRFVQDLGINIQKIYLKNLCYYLNIHNDLNKEEIELDQFIKLFENIQDDKVSIMKTFYAQSDSTKWNLRLLNKDTYIIITELIKLAIKKIYDLNQKLNKFNTNEILYAFQKISNKQDYILWEQFIKFMNLQDLEFHPGDNFYVFYEINGNLSKRIFKEQFINFFKNFKSFQFQLLNHNKTKYFQQ